MSPLPKSEVSLNIFHVRYNLSFSVLTFSFLKAQRPFHSIFFKDIFPKLDSHDLKGCLPPFRLFRSRRFQEPSRLPLPFQTDIARVRDGSQTQVLRVSPRPSRESPLDALSSFFPSVSEAMFFSAVRSSPSARLPPQPKPPFKARQLLPPLGVFLINLWPRVFELGRFSPQSRTPILVPAASPPPFGTSARNLFFLSQSRLFKAVSEGRVLLEHLLPPPFHLVPCITSILFSSFSNLRHPEVRTLAIDGTREP